MKGEYSNLEDTPAIENTFNFEYVKCKLEELRGHKAA